MNKSKYEPTDYLSFYNAALAAYTKTVLGANALMLEYSIAATRTMLRATALATPVTPAVAVEAAVPVASQDAELAKIEASLYDDDAERYSGEAAVAEPGVTATIIEPTKEPPDRTAPPRSSASKKAGTRRRRSKK